MHLISCNWLPFYRPCSFASQTFIWFADFLIIDIAFKLMQKNWFYYTIALYCTQEKHYRFNAWKQKKNSRYIYSNCSSTFEVHEALTLLFPAHLYSDRSISLKLLPALLSDSPNYLPEKTAIICIYWYHAFHIKMLFYPQYASLPTSNYTSFPH